MSKIIGNTVGTTMNPKKIAIAGASACEIDPVYIRKAGTYVAKVHFEAESEENHIDVFAIDEIGDNIYPPFFSRGFFSGNNEILPVENEFEMELPYDCYGLNIQTNGRAVLYATADKAIKALQTEVEEALGSYITDIDLLLGGD